MVEISFEQQKEIIELKHKYKMEELKGDRQNIKLNHELQLDAIRAKSEAVNETRRNIYKK